MVNTEFADFLEATLKGKIAGPPSFTELPNRYPYFYIGHVLELMRLKGSNDLAFSDELRITSLLSPNRERLKNIVEEKRVIPVTKEDLKQTQPIFPALEEIPETVFEINLEPAVLEQIVDYPELDKAEKRTDKKVSDGVDEFRTKKKTFSAWLKQVGTANREELETPELELQTSDREVLIRKFIETEPQISKAPKASFYSAAEMARKSTEERDDIVSETLAGIYAQQGDMARALRIYQKLCLLYPEKSSYFAALIQKLNTNT